MSQSLLLPTLAGVAAGLAVGLVFILCLPPEPAARGRRRARHGAARGAHRLRAEARARRRRPRRRSSLAGEDGDAEAAGGLRPRDPAQARRVGAGGAAGGGALPGPGPQGRGDERPRAAARQAGGDAGRRRSWRSGPARARPTGWRRSSEPGWSGSPGSPRRMRAARSSSGSRTRPAARPRRSCATSRSRPRRAPTARPGRSSRSRSSGSPPSTPRRRTVAAVSLPERRDEGPHHRARGAEHPRVRDRHRAWTSSSTTRPTRWSSPASIRSAARSRAARSRR